MQHRAAQLKMQACWQAAESSHTYVQSKPEAQEKRSQRTGGHSLEHASSIFLSMPIVCFIGCFLVTAWK